jgi:hypothetical protein
VVFDLSPDIIKSCQQGVFAYRVLQTFAGREFLATHRTSVQPEFNYQVYQEHVTGVWVNSPHIDQLKGNLQAVFKVAIVVAPPPPLSP